MTRARSHTWAVGISPLIQPLLEAVLCVFVSLVHSVRATFGMRRWIGTRDWHTQSETSALPQTKPDIRKKASPNQQRSFSGKRSASRESRLEPQWGPADHPLEALNQDSRDKPENDTVEVEAPEPKAGLLARAPCAGGDPVSAQRALLPRTSLTVIPAAARQREELEPRGHAHLRHQPPGFRRALTRVRNDNACALASSLS